MSLYRGNADTLIRYDLGMVVSEASTKERDMFIADRVMPIVPTLKRVDAFFVGDEKSELADPATIERADKAEYVEVEQKYGEDTFICKEFGVKSPLSDKEIAEDGTNIPMLEQNTADRAALAVKRARERRVVRLLQDTTSIPTASAITPWATIATADPLMDVLTAKEAMRNSKGITPNVGVVTKPVFLLLQRNAKIMAQYQYTQPLNVANSNVFAGILADYFGLTEIIVATAQYDTAKKGAEVSKSDIWSSAYFGMYMVTNKLDRKNKEPHIGHSC